MSPDGVTGPDTERIRRAVVELLEAVGEDPTREGLRDTPRRIADLYREVLEGQRQDPRELLRVGFEENHQEMVIVRDITFYSLCEHHLLPFHGIFHVGYIPRGRVVGISKLARVVDAYSRRLQLQERLTSQIADVLMEELDPVGVAVLGSAEHLCMTMRGVKKPGTQVTTSATRGVFRTSEATRLEFFAAVGERR
jgi:GTP cyclohydrolase I